jgi:hypothetical protein
MDKNLADILEKLAPFSAEEQNLVDKLMEMENSTPDAGRELYEAKKKSRTPVKEGRPRKIGLPIKKPDPAKRAANRKALGEALVRNLNANVLKDHPEKSNPGENINKSGDSNDKRPSE